MKNNIPQPGGVDVGQNELHELILEVKRLVAEIKEEVTNNAFEIRGLRMEIGLLRSDMNKRFDMVLSSLKGLTGLITNGQVDKAATESALNRHERTLESHEDRIEKLEKNAA